MRAALLEVLEAAPERVAAPCPYFMRCGGCHYQHAPYEMQLALEARDSGGPVAAHRQDRRRQRSRWWRASRGAIAIACNCTSRTARWDTARRNRTSFAPIEKCPIASPAINAAIAVLREMLRDPRWPRFVRSIELFTNETQMQLNVLETERPVARRFFDWCAERIPGLVPERARLSRPPDIVAA